MLEDRNEQQYCSPHCIFLHLVKIPEQYSWWNPGQCTWEENIATNSYWSMVSKWGTTHWWWCGHGFEENYFLGMMKVTDYLVVSKNFKALFSTSHDMLHECRIITNFFTDARNLKSWATELYLLSIFSENSLLDTCCGLLAFHTCIKSINIVLETAVTYHIKSRCTRKSNKWKCIVNANVSPTWGSVSLGTWISLFPIRMQRQRIPSGGWRGGVSLLLPLKTIHWSLISLMERINSWSDGIINSWSSRFCLRYFL